MSLTFTGPGGTETVPARREGGRWVSERALADGEAAYVGAGCVKDPFGNFNGAASAVVGASGVEPDSDECATRTVLPAAAIPGTATVPVRGGGVRRRLDAGTGPGRGGPAPRACRAAWA